MIKNMELFHQTHIYAQALPLIVIKANDLDYRAHWHSEAELLCVLSGSLVVSINKTRQVASTGSIVICDSRDIHQYERDSRHSTTIAVLFKPEIIGNRPSWPLTGRVSENIVTRNQHQALSLRIEAITRSLLEETTEKRPGMENIARGYVLELCGLIERELVGTREAVAALEAVAVHEPVAGREIAPKERPSTIDFADRMRAAIDYIHEKAGYPIMLEDIAKAVSLSPCYFSRIFKRTVGSSFSRFVNEVRIERAERLMATTRKTIAEIALECGFDSLRTFNRAFQSIRGATPSAKRSYLS
jgi:AraC-like DNA-binding protein